jgi:CheY-specific phosphatase CheX
MTSATRRRRALAAEKAMGSISERARTSFDYMMSRAWRSTMQAEGDSAQVEPVAEFLPKPKEKQAIVLTIAGYAMRVVVALYFKLDDDTRAHFERLNRVEPGTMDEQALRDALAECGNICAGALNRALGEHFPHIGMSTPNLLSRESLSYADALGKGYARHFQLIGLAQPYWASLYVVAYADIDFAVDIEADDSDTADTGEMEMF